MFLVLQVFGHKPKAFDTLNVGSLIKSYEDLLSGNDTFMIFLTILTVTEIFHKTWLSMVVNTFDSGPKCWTRNCWDLKGFQQLIQFAYL